MKLFTKYLQHFCKRMTSEKLALLQHNSPCCHGSFFSVGFEARMRLKKSKEKDSENRNQQITASVSKLICTTKGQSSTLNGEMVAISFYTYSVYTYFAPCLVSNICTVI